jgi:hypothetical protein
MSNLSELLPSGGGQNVVEFTADGAISSGEAVALQTDGTVKAISASASAQVVGSTTAFDTNQASFPAVTYDSVNQKIVIAYKDTNNSNYGTAIVGTVSGNSISFGTPVVFQSAGTLDLAITFDSSNEKIVIGYRPYTTNSYGTAIVGTVSGTSISFGSAATFESAVTINIAMTYDSTNQKVVICYTDYGNSSYGTSIVGTVSGTSISFGSATVFESADTQHIKTVYDVGSGKIVTAYKDSGNSSYGTSIIGTVSGTSISFGSPVVFESANSSQTGMAYDSTAQKVVIAYTKFFGGYTPYAIVGTVSGTSISFGTATTFDSGQTSAHTVTYDSSTDSIVIVYRDQANSGYGTFAVGKVSGTSISFTSPTVFDSSGDIGGDMTDIQWSTYDSANQRVVVTYVQPNDSSPQPFDGLAFTIKPVGSNKSDFIGLASAAISDTAAGDINVKGGINEAQTGLTIGSDYYVQNDGTLSTTSSSVKVGKAITATTINMMDLT